MCKNISFTIFQTLPHFAKFPQTLLTHNISTDPSLKKIDFAYKITRQSLCVSFFIPFVFNHLTIFHTIFNE